MLLGVCQPCLSSPCQEPYRTKHTLMPGWFWCVSQRGYFPECKPQGAPAEYPERPPGQQPHAMRRTSHAGKRVFSVSNTRARVPSKENTRTSVWANDYQSQTRKDELSRGLRRYLKTVLSYRYMLLSRGHRTAVGACCNSNWNWIHKPQVDQCVQIERDSFHCASVLLVEREIGNKSGKPGHVTRNAARPPSPVGRPARGRAA